MKYLDKLINFVFSLIILVLSIIVIMVTAGFTQYSEIDNYMRNNVFSDANNTVTCITAIITTLAALKTTIFLSKNKNNNKTAIVVDTTHGKVQIASETIESTAKTVINNYDSIKDAQVRMLKAKKGVNIYMVLLVLPNTNIIELSSNVQDAVKEAIEDTTGVKVNNVDIKIKNITDTKKYKSKEKVATKEQTIKEQVVVAEPSLEEVTETVTEEVELSEVEVIPEENKEEVLEENIENK